jgi:hypothetical protein
MPLVREEVERDLERQRAEVQRQTIAVANTRASIAVMQKQLDDGERRLEYLRGRAEVLEQVLDALGGPGKPKTAPGAPPASSPPFAAPAVASAAQSAGAAGAAGGSGAAEGSAAGE